MPDHIKMPDIAPIVRYVANGTQTTFEYPFPIFAGEDLKVYFDGAPQYAGYDIHDAGNTSGGTITFDTAPADGIVSGSARDVATIFAPRQAAVPNAAPSSMHVERKL